MLIKYKLVLLLVIWLGAMPFPVKINNGGYINLK